MLAHTLSNEEAVRQCDEFYEKNLRSMVETENNIGKIIVFDVQTGDYEIDTVSIAASERLHKKHPDAALYATRIGFDAVYGFGGNAPRRTKR